MFVGENPARSDAFDTPAIRGLLEDGYTVVQGDQCQWGLRGTIGFHRKRTWFLVPRGSCFETELQRACPGTGRDHPHQPVFGGKQVTEPAGNWPWALCETLLLAATQELVLRSTRIADELKGFEAKAPDKTLQLTGHSHEVICGELYLRR